jgi:hypothetical protein
MPELDELLREEFHAAVSGLGRTPELDARVAGHVRRVRARQRRAARVAALALVVLAVAPIGWLVTRGSGSDRPDVDAGSRADGLAPDDPALADVTYLVPDSLPDGLELQLAAGGLRPGVPTWDRYEWLDNVQPTGGASNPLVLRERRLLPGDPDPMALLARSGTATSVAGYQAVASPAGVWLAWVDADDVFHLLTRPGPAPPTGDAAFAELRGLADGTIPIEPLPVAQPPTGPGVSVPSGLGSQAPFHVVNPAPAGSDDTNARVMYFTDGDGRQLTVSVADASIPLMHPEPGEGTAVQVRGRDALLAPTTASRYDPFVVGLVPVLDSSVGAAPTALTWRESDGVAVTLIGSGLSDDELVAVADGLRRVDAETWASYLRTPPDEGTGETVPIVPQPTIVQPDATTVPPDSAVTLPPPPPGAQRLEGASTGTERWVETSGGCPTLDHTTDETVTMADGTAWAYHGTHCGELSQSQTQWRGGGDITLTTAGGDTITLQWTHDWLPVPPTRVQILATVTGGTGAWAGATGTCLIDEGLTMGVFAVNGNSFHQGTVTCDVAV